MLFDPKKISIIIAKAGGMAGKNYEDGNKEDDKIDDYAKEGLEMAMEKFIEAVKSESASSASDALAEWCKIYKSYEENNIQPEDKEEY